MLRTRLEQDNALEPVRIVQRGRGPEVEGTRITVYEVFEYRRAGWARDAIAATLRLSSHQVQAALDYIQEHELEVSAVYDRAMDRVRQGNPAWVEERLKQNRSKVEALLARSRESRHGVAEHAAIMADIAVVGQFGMLVPDGPIRGLG